MRSRILVQYLSLVTALSAAFAVASFFVLGNFFFDSQTVIQRLAGLSIARISERTGGVDWIVENKALWESAGKGVWNVLAFDAWEIDGKGNVLAATEPGGLPWPASALVYPTIPYDVVPLENISTFSHPVRVLKLSAPNRYMVVRANRGQSVGAMLMVFLVLFTGWLTVGTATISVIVVFLYFRNRSREAVSVLSRLTAGELSARFNVTRFDEVGRLMGIFNRMADEIERLVKRLHETESTRSAFLQEISHDIRTPLTATRTALETLRGNFDALEEGDRKRCVAIATDELAYLAKLIEDLFFLTEMREPRYRDQAMPVDLEALVHGEIERRRASSGGSITWGWSVTPGLEAVVQGDEALLSRCLRNGLDNAGRFARTRVDVELRRNGVYGLFLVIRDDGPGVSDEAIRSFGTRRSDRLRSGSLSSGESLGLGSVIMNAIAEAHGATVTLANRRDGISGAELIFSFSLLADAAQSGRSIA